MKRKLSIQTPIFEIGPKLYVHGKEAVAMAEFADTLVDKYDVQIIFSAQCMDIPVISQRTRNIYVFAQHVDGVLPGRGVGAILPEAVRDAGAEGTLLNHAEKKMTLNDLSRAILRCKEVGLISLVCADSVAECIAAANLGADIILKESEDMIGMGNGEKHNTIDIIETDAEIRKHKPDAIVLHGAGIENEVDAYNIIYGGATATGVTSAIFTAIDPFEAMERNIAAVRRAWDDRKLMLESIGRSALP